VFLPVVFLQGIAAQLFRDMALTVSFSLLASLAVSLTLIPMMAALVGGSGASQIATTGPVTEPIGRVRGVLRSVFVTLPSLVLRGVRFVLRWLGRGLSFLARPVSVAFDKLLGGVAAAYPRVLRGALRARPVVLALALVAFAGAVWLVPRLGFDLIPTFSQGEFSFLIELPEGTPLEATDRFLEDVESVLEGNPAVASHSTIAGGRGLSLTSTGTEGENSGRVQVRMAAGTTPEQEGEVIADLRRQLETSGLARFKFERPTFFSFRTPIEVEVYSDRLSELHAAAARLKERIAGIPGLVDVKSSAELGNPELQVFFDRNQLSQLGLSLGEVADTLRNKVQGEVATRFTEGDREIDIVVRSVEVGRASVGDVEDFIIGQRDGVPIFLKSVAEVALVEGPSEIRRIGQKRAGVISGNLVGRDMGAVAADVRAAIDEQTFPAGVGATLS
jgi:HAE1 family hydrophobic/amphiphilic exporter-1